MIDTALTFLVIGGLWLIVLELPPRDDADRDENFRKHGRWIP